MAIEEIGWDVLPQTTLVLTNTATQSVIISTFQNSSISPNSHQYTSVTTSTHQSPPTRFSPSLVLPRTFVEFESIQHESTNLLGIVR